MGTGLSKSKQQEYTSKLTLMGIFMTMFALFISRKEIRQGG